MSPKKGRPRLGKQVRKVYSIRLEPKDAAYLRKLGEGSMSQAISNYARRLRVLGG